MSMNANCCRLDIPYPPVKTTGKCQNAASLLTNDYAGPVSEMSSISAYTFQHIANGDEELKNALGCIAMVEMHHFEMLGQLIKEFGGCPRIGMRQSGCGWRYWTAQYVSWETEPAAFLRENIRNERAAIACYTARIAQIDDECAKKVLERIILDEQHHISIFTGFLNRYS